MFITARAVNELSLVFVGSSKINLDAHSDDIDTLHSLFDLMDVETNEEIADDILVS